MPGLIVQCQCPQNPVLIRLLCSFVGAAEHYASSGLMWTLALDGNGNPKLPGTDSCSTPCRPVVTINSDGSYSYNQECESIGLALLYR